MPLTWELLRKDQSRECALAALPGSVGALAPYYVLWISRCSSSYSTYILLCVTIMDLREILFRYPIQPIVCRGWINDDPDGWMDGRMPVW